MAALTITEGTFHIFTFKDGILSKVAHDLRLSALSFEIGIEGERVTVRVPTQGIRVDGAMKKGRLNARTLSAKDNRDVIKNIEKDVLKTSTFPAAHFEGRIQEPDSERFSVDGDLELVGRKRPLTITVERRDGRLVARAEIVQSRFGIKPFSAMLGAMKVKDRVEVEVTVNDPRS